MTDTVSPPGPTISEQSESVGGNPLEELARRLAATEPVSREQPPRPSPTGRLSRLSSELRAR